MHLHKLTRIDNSLLNFIVLFCFLFFSFNSNAAEINFDAVYGNSGNIAQKIQNAINNAADDDAIIFNSPYYNLGGNVLITIDKPITLQGATIADLNTTTVGASKIKTVLYNTATFAIRSNNVKFKNISIVRKNQGEGVFDILIDARHPSYLIADPVSVNQEQYTGLKFNNVVLNGGAYCFHSGNGVGIVMRNCSMINWRRTGFWANRLGRSYASPKMNFNYCFVDTDEIVGFDDRGFSFDAGNSEYPVIWDFNDTHVQNSKIINTGIALSRCENMTIINNIFEDKEGAIDIIHIEEFSNNVRVNGNVFDCKVENINKRTRIVQLDRELQISSNLEFKNNRIVGSYNFFISAYAPTNIIVTGNDFTDANAVNDHSINLAYYESRDREPITKELVSNNITVINNPGLGSNANKGFKVLLPNNNAVFDINNYTESQKDIKRLNPAGAEFPDGIYEIVSVETDEKLTMSSSGFGLTTSNVNNETSQWRITFKPPYAYHIQNVSNDKYLETHVGYTEFDVIQNKPQNIFPFLNNPTETLPFWAIKRDSSNNFEIFPGGNERQSILTVNGGFPKLAFTISIDGTGVRSNLPLTADVRWIIRAVATTNNNITENTAPIGSIISIRKTGGDRNFVSAVAELGQDLYANKTNVESKRQQFLVEQHPLGGIALKSIASEKYIRIQAGNNFSIVDALGGKGGWSRLEWKSLGKNKVAFKSLANNLWLQAPHVNNFTPLYAKGTSAREWETFEFTIVENSGITNQNRDLLNEDFVLKSKNTMLKIYPTVIFNNQNLTIETNGAVDNTVDIMNTYGQFIKTIKVESKYQEINTEDLKSGIYILSLNNGKKTTKFIVN